MMRVTLKRKTNDAERCRRANRIEAKKNVKRDVIGHAKIRWWRNGEKLAVRMKKNAFQEAAVDFERDVLVMRR